MSENEHSSGEPTSTPIDSQAIHVVRGGVLYELHPEPEGGYTISVPLLPGCFSFGETIDQALENVKQAIALWAEGAAELGHEIPEQFALQRAS